jgi:hypothetical protein
MKLERKMEAQQTTEQYSTVKYSTVQCNDLRVTESRSQSLISQAAPVYPGWHLHTPVMVLQRPMLLHTESACAVSPDVGSSNHVTP